MTNHLKKVGISNLSVCFIILLSSGTLHAQKNVRLYTPYTQVEVPPGETVDYSITIQNKSDKIENVALTLSGLPKSWDYSLKAGGYSIKEVSVLPGDKKNIKLKVGIPLKVNKGNHRFKVVAQNKDVLALNIRVSEQGIYKSEFTSDQINMQGHSKSNFKFSTKLKNQTAEKQVYSLKALPPKGWKVIFKPNRKQATAVEVDPNSTSSISVEITPPFNVSAGTYKIPVQASNRNTSASLDLEVVVTGSYDISLSTPTGLLSTKTTAGKEKRIELELKNTGSTDLGKIKLSASRPKNWDVTFEPDTISRLRPGETTHAYALIKAYEKAIPGDYVATFTAKTDEVSSKATFRISVKTPLLWGWLGILIVALSLGFVFWLFKKYGRR